MLLEIKQSKQILINNGYSNREVDDHTYKFLKNGNKVNTNAQDNTHHLYYRNYMNSHYREDEIALKEMIRTNITMKATDTKVKLTIYYKTNKTSQLVVKNNLGPKPRDLAKSHLVYDYNCQKDTCKHLKQSQITYTGVTKCKLSCRLSYHLQHGAIQAYC